MPRSDATTRPAGRKYMKSWKLMSRYGPIKSLEDARELGIECWIVDPALPKGTQVSTRFLPKYKLRALYYNVDYNVI